MRKKNFCLAFFAFFTIQILFTGSGWAGLIRLNHQTLDTSKASGITSSSLPASSNVFSGNNASAPVIVQFEGPIQPQWLEKLKAAGAEIHFYIPDYAYLVTMPVGKAVQVRNSKEVQWAGQLAPKFKIRPSLAAAVSESAGEEIDVVILSLDDAPVDSLNSKSIKIKKTRKTPMGWQDTRVRVPASEVSRLAELPSVFHLEKQPVYRLHGERTAQTAAGNYNPGDTTPFGPGYLNWLDSQGLSGGQGLVVQVVDDGLDQGLASNLPGTAHPDILGRIAGVFNATSDSTAGSKAGHGQINAGIIIGNASAGLTDGDGYLLGMGVAPRAQVHGTKVFNDLGYYDTGNFSLSDLVKIGQDAGALFCNNSWGADSQGEYTADAAEFDALCRDADPEEPGNQPMAIFISAGNAGPGLGTVGSPASGKNVFSVGASENSDADGVDGCSTPPADADSINDLADFSSKGPAADGRLGVTIVSVGTHVQGPAPTLEGYDGSGVCDQYWPSGQELYSRSSGTSHSSPAACGAGMIIYEFFQNHDFPAGQEHPTAPSPAFLKAVMTTTAQDLAGGDNGQGGVLNPVPDDEQGWGAVNLNNLFLRKDALFSQDQEHLFTASGQEFEIDIQPSDSAFPLKITLAWTDPPAIPGADPTLINNLDLQVSGPEGTYLGNVFSGGFSRTGAAADNLNNLESVFIENPSGTYTIKVLAQNIAGDGAPNNATELDQDFALFVWNGVNQSSRGFVKLDKRAYRCADHVEIKVSDADLKGGGALIVSATSGGGDAENLSLSETSGDSGIYTGEILTAVGPPLADGVLQVVEGQDIAVVYQDEDTGAGESGAATAGALVDCSPPEILNATTVSILARKARIEVQTNEDSRVGILYGRNCSRPINFRSGPAGVSTHQIELTGLLPETTYYYVMSATDAAGNFSRFPVDSGECLEFTTPVQPDFLTEQFAQREFDLLFRSLRFIPEEENPDFYRVCVEEADRLPSDYEQAAEIILTDDDSFEVDFPPGQAFPFFDQVHEQVYIGSNGYLTLNNPDEAYGDTLTNHFSTARISGFFRDFDPSSGGQVLYELLDDRLVVTYLGVPEYDTQNENTFQVELFYDGVIQMTWMAIQSRSGIVGLSPGGGVPEGFINSVFSTTGPCISSSGNLLWDRPAYRDEARAFLELRDADLAGQGIQCVTIETRLEDEESLCLQESAEYPGFFTGEITLTDKAVAPGNQLLEAAHGDFIRALYIDEVNDSGQTNLPVIAEATADYVAPEILGASVTETLGTLARFEVRTNEPTIGGIHAGVQCGTDDYGVQSNRPELVHSLELPGLEENTLYYYVAAATDEAGNRSVADNDGQCFTFSTTRAVDYFTRDLVLDPQDLEDISLLWTPNGSEDFYFMSRLPVENFPVNPSTHETVSLGDDDYYEVMLRGEKQVYFYGQAYSSFFIGSNGFLTFGAGDDTYNPSLARHFALVRFSGYFEDLAPSGGDVMWKQLADRVVVTFHQVRNYSSTLVNSFQYELFFDGRLRLTRLEIEGGGGIIGLSRGEGLPADYVPTDFLAAPLTRESTPAVFWMIH